MARLELPCMQGPACCVTLFQFFKKRNTSGSVSIAWSQPGTAGPAKRCALGRARSSRPRRWPRCRRRPGLDLASIPGESTWGSLTQSRVLLPGAAAGCSFVPALFCVNCSTLFFRGRLSWGGVNVGKSKGSWQATANASLSAPTLPSWAIHSC